MSNVTLQFRSNTSGDDGYWSSSVFQNSSSTALMGRLENNSYNAFILFRNVIVPKNAVIISAYVRLVVSGYHDTSIIDVAINDTATPTVPTNISEADTLSLTPSIQWTEQSGSATPDIGSLVQQIVNKNSWDTGGEVLVVFKDAKLEGQNYYRDFYTIEYSTRYRPLLEITYTLPDGWLLKNSSVSGDDGYSSNDAFYNALTYLRFGMNGASYKSFMRFPSIPIDNSSQIRHAYTIMTLSMGATGAGTIRFNDVADAVAPTTGKEVTDLARTTGAEIASTYSEGNQIYVLPDLVTDLQSIINKAEWTSGNAVMVIIDGSSGDMRPYSYNNGSSYPLLLIEYDAPPMPESTRWLSEPRTLEVALGQYNVPDDNSFLQYDETFDVWVTRTTPEIDHISEATAAHGVTVDGVTLKDGGALVVTGGTNIFNLTNGTAVLDVAAASTVNIDKGLTVNGSFATTLASEGQANTITLNESFTIGNGTNVTIISEDNATTVTLDNATFEVENTNATQRLVKITSDKDGNTTLSLKENLSVGDGYDVTLTALGQANTLTLNEGLTVGDGSSGTITFSAASKTLTVAESITLNPIAVGALLVAASANTVDDLAVGLTTQILVGGGAATVPSWGTDLPTAVTIGTKYIYRDGGTDVAVADGGTGLSSGTSGGILGYTAAGTLASSVALTDSVLVVGGGAGATPTPLADGLGATTEYLRGNAAGEPTWETLNQAAVAGLTASSSPTFVTTKLSGLSADVFPYNRFTPDLLDEDCSDISDWTDGDADGAESSVDPAGQFKFDTGDGADEGDPYAQRYRVISAPPDKFTIEFKTYFDALGTIVNSDFFYMTYRSSTWRFQVIMTSDHMSIRKAGAANYTYFYGVVKCNASAAWQVWRFQVDKSAGEDAATVEVFLDGVSLGTCDCDYEVAGTNGYIQFIQTGYTTDHRISHIDYIKVATGLGEISGGLVDSIVSKYGKSVLINGGLNVGGSTDPGDNNLLVDGTGTITGGFGCNSKTAQNAYASGGALSAYSTGAYGYDTAEHAQEIHTLLVNIRAALVANGIMS